VLGGNTLPVRAHPKRGWKASSCNPELFLNDYQPIAYSNEKDFLLKNVHAICTVGGYFAQPGLVASGPIANLRAL
jgi:hypothetical protein